jgi:putative hemolysin
MHLSGPWARLFHFFDRFSGELRDITLFHELLNKRGRQYRLTVGHPADPAAIGSTDELKHFVERVLPADPDRRLT